MAEIIDTSDFDVYWKRKEELINRVIEEYNIDSDELDDFYDADEKAGFGHPKPNTWEELEIKLNDVAKQVLKDEQYWKEQDNKLQALKPRIVELLVDKAVKMPASDIDAFLKHQNVDEIKELCEQMYHNGEISRTANYRYFIITEEKKQSKKASAPKSEAVDIEKELEKFKGMLDKGLINQEDYDVKKKELLGL